MNGDAEVLGAADLTAEEELRALWGRCDYRGATHTHSGPCPEDFQLLVDRALDTARDSRPVGETVREAIGAVDAIAETADALHDEAQLLTALEVRNAARDIAIRLNLIRSVLQAGPAAVRPATEDERSFYRPGEIVGWAGPDRRANDASAVRPVKREGLAETPTGRYFTDHFLDMRPHDIVSVEAEAADACEERERDLRDALLEGSYFHVKHDGTPRHPETCNDCRALAETGRSAESPR